MLTILLCALLCADESREAAIAAARTKYRTLALAAQQKDLEDSLRRTKGKEEQIAIRAKLEATKRGEVFANTTFFLGQLNAKSKQADVGEMASFVPTKQLDDGRFLVNILDAKTNREATFVLDAPTKQFKLYSNCGMLDPCWVSGTITVGEKSILVVELLPLDGLPHQRGLRSNR